MADRHFAYQPQCGVTKSRLVHWNSVQLFLQMFMGGEGLFKHWVCFRHQAWGGGYNLHIAPPPQSW